jgi:acetate kinase
MSLLILNAGSSSLKFALYDRAPAAKTDPIPLLAGQIDGLGSHPHLRVTDAQGIDRQDAPLHSRARMRCATRATPSRCCSPACPNGGPARS